MPICTVKLLFRTRLRDRAAEKFDGLSARVGICQKLFRLDAAAAENPADDFYRCFSTLGDWLWLEKSFSR